MISPFKEKMQSALDRSYLQRKWKKYSKDSFPCRIPLHLDHEKYVVKTIDSFEELQKVLHLRYRVFIVEGLKKRKPVRVDLEDFDFWSDHLVVMTRETEEIVGTYRLISSLFSKNFYSQNEFDLSELVSKPDVKLELGRACIHPDFRNGSVIALLWRGLRTYMDKTQSRYLFGCGSVKTTSAEDASLISSYLTSQGQLTDEFKVRPTSKYRMANYQLDLKRELSEDERARARSLVPTLIKSYIRAGARLEGEPALDKDFHCIDYLTVLDSERFDARHDLRFRD